MPQCADDVHGDQNAKQIGNNSVQFLEQIVQAAVVDDLRHRIPSKSLAIGVRKVPANAQPVSEAANIST